MLIALKLCLTPIIVTALTLAARRWGPAVAGVLAGLPLTSGPVSFFFALQYGAPFAHTAVVGSLLAVLGVVATSMTYAWMATRYLWPVCLACAVLAYTAVVVLVSHAEVSVYLAAALAIGALSLAMLVAPKSQYAARLRTTPRWDVPARAIIATLIVLFITAIAHMLGPELAGAIAPFPVFVMLVTTFAHRHDGGPAAIATIRGVIHSLPGFVGFFVVVGLCVEHFSIGVTYFLAIMTGCLLGGAAIARRARFA